MSQLTEVASTQQIAAVASSAKESLRRKFDVSRPRTTISFAVALPTTLPPRGTLASNEYPRGKLGEQLGLVANGIGAELPCRVYYVRQSGYDTHAAQLSTHAQLLRRLSDGLAAFQSDLHRSGLADRVTVITFSEFGRRVRENSAEGTDHGTAGPVLVLGSSVEGGIHGRTPDLNDTADGDLNMSVDFRTVYASILEKWLQVDSAKALEAEFSTISLFKNLS